VVVAGRILILLMILRLLMPPGICACKASSPAGRLLAIALRLTPTPQPEVVDDDHSPGCPASVFSTGLGVAPPAGPGSVPFAAFPFEDFFVPASSLPPFSSCPFRADFLPLATPGGGLYLSLCALLI
jgi:hypothetical protein